ncbi:AMP-binding protein [Auritidibacter ignavus]|uniref:AMP-binding protein n=1 Tax=Auritidibacter ignavus TaxID=678932 RepID=UPI0015D62426|nr:AMP-binding protein [Auritidibacter ignavus]
MPDIAIAPCDEQSLQQTGPFRRQKVDLLSTHLPVSQLRKEISARFDDGRAFKLTNSPPDSLPPSCQINTAQDLDIAVVQQTSGTTGRPRQFVFSRSAIEEHALATAQVMSLSKQASVALAITPGTAYYTSVLMMANVTDSPVTIINPLNVRDAVERIRTEPFASLDAGVRFWQTIEHFVRRDPRLLRAIQKIPIRGVGGDPLPASTESRYRQHEAALTNGYGLTQAGPNVAIGVRADPSIPGNCGYPLPEVELKVIDGELYVRSPYAATAEIIDSTARSIPEMSAQGWLQTGDRATIIAGQLIPQGRFSQHSGGES